MKNYLFLSIILLSVVYSSCNKDCETASCKWLILVNPSNMADTSYRNLYTLGEIPKNMKFTEIINCSFIEVQLCPKYEFTKYIVNGITYYNNEDLPYMFIKN